MKKTMRRLLTIALALVLLCTTIPAAFAEDDICPETGTKTVYLESKSGETVVCLKLAYGFENFTIKRSGIKITPGDTGAKLVSFEKQSESFDYDAQIYDPELDTWEGDGYNETIYCYEIGLRVNHSGTAKVSYKIGKKSYTITVKVKAYTNPVSSITLTGVNSGKNFASKCKTKMPYAPTLSFPSTVKSGTLVIKPISGWKISYVSFKDTTSGTYRCRSNDKGLSSVSMKVGKLYPSHKYSVRITFLNTSNKATLNWDFGF